LMKRSYNRELLMNVSEHYPDLLPEHLVDYWLNEPHNYMYAEDRSIGMFTYEYPGVFTGHWFFTDDHRGRKAITLARRILKQFFSDTNVKVIRGLVKEDNKASRWAARQAGFTSYGLMDFPKGKHELFMLTKDDFYEQEGTLKWAE
jgi:RimJ/RimL family protein N-acetyltransferase